MIQRFGRYLKLKGLQLLRSPGGPRMVAMGFSVGLAVEFITLLTFGAGFLLIFPLIRILRGSIATSVIGFVFGKLILPIFIPIGYKIGKSYFSFHIPGIPQAVLTYMSTLSGMLFLGVLAGFVMYYPVYFLYLSFHKRRQRKRKLKKMGV